MALVAADDPFKDPSLDTSPAATPQPPDDVPITLAVGRNASLTLGTDSLVVLGTTICRIFRETSANECRRGAAGQ
ncbi:hypothetical protein CC78DRAFT_531157 [Lojkania enalia]|uniref:Uncharacterized protein n=1 Tax=Lojkania enalia TaxID=147567 RepID=A0A9P4N7Q5_9PLEO|nr:hypothetical protein CC78DRAFT_531157 [Didymosphaeria enalia]